MRPKDCSLCAKINKKAPDRVTRGKCLAAILYKVCPEDGVKGYFESFTILLDAG